MMVLPAAVDIFTIEFFIYHFCERDKKRLASASKAFIKLNFA